MKRKQRKNAGSRINLSSFDIDAILCALPLVADAEVDTPAQARLNRLSCDAAANKLTSGVSVFSAEEIRVMYVAVEFALAVIGGVGNAYVSTDDLDDEWRAELTGYLFSYNRLRSFFSGLFPNV